MSPVCRASPFKTRCPFHYNFLLKIILLYIQTGLARLKRGARFHYNFLLKIILLYIQTELACLGGISLDSNGTPGQPGLKLSM